MWNLQNFQEVDVDSLDIVALKWSALVHITQTEYLHFSEYYSMTGL